MKMNKHKQELRDEKKKAQEEKMRRQAIRATFVNVVPTPVIAPSKQPTTDPVTKKYAKTIKRGLLIGINYTNTAYQLNGCINDSMNLSYFLSSNKYIPKENLIMMSDDQKGDLYPTKANIIKQFTNLVTFAKSNLDAEVLMFLSYSGHGTHVKCKNGDESDGWDEALCPIDCDASNESSFLVDDDIKKKFVDLLPQNVKLFVLIDACHSGTMLDLKYNYVFERSLFHNKTYYNTIQVAKESLCDIVMISGCKDSETSNDAYLVDYRTNSLMYEGAMTASFLETFKDNITYEILVSSMRSWLNGKQYKQVPQLSSGKVIDAKSAVFLSIYDEY